MAPPQQPRSAGRMLLAALGLGLILLPLLGLLRPGRIAVDRDLAPYFLPMRAYTAERMLAGELPLWNPLNGLGEPWLANPQVGVFYPPNLLFLLLPLDQALNASLLLHLLLGAAGMLRLLQRLRLAPEAAWLGAAAWALGGASLSSLSAINVFAAAAYLPWLWDEVLDPDRPPQRARLALLLLLQFLAGEPILLLWGFASASFLDAWLIAHGARALEPGAGARRQSAPRAWLERWLVAGSAAAALGAAQLLPTLEWIAHSRRLVEWSSTEALAKSMRWQDLLGLISDAWRPSAGYLASLLLGPVVLLLAIAAVRAPWPARLGRAMLAMGVVGWLFALGRNLPGGALLAALPPLSWNRYPARHFLLTHAVLAVAAAYGLHGCRLRWGRQAAWLSWLLALAGAAPLLLGAARAVTLRPTQEVLDLRPFAGLEAELAHPMGRVFAQPISRFQVAHQFPERRHSAATSLRQQRLLSGYTNLLYRIAVIDTPSPAGLAAIQPWLEVVRAGPAGLGALELLSGHWLVGRFAAPRSGLEKVAQLGGVAVYRDRRAQPRFSLHPGAVVRNGSVAAWVGARARGERRLWLAAGSDADLPALRGPDRPTSDRARIQLERAEPERIELRVATPIPLWLLVTDADYPGWSCAVGGQPRAVRATVGGLRAVPLEPGRHRVRFEYRPWSFRIGLGLSLATAIFLLGRFIRRLGFGQLKNGPDPMPENDPLGA